MWSQPSQPILQAIEFLLAFAQLSSLEMLTIGLISGKIIYFPNSKKLECGYS